ncbi:MAG: lipid II flippase MurJ [Actinomycetes bacterium]
MTTVRRRVLTLASGTMISRVSGLLRTLVLAYVLGFTPLADGFNLANTIPNSLYDLVLGGVIGATFLSVFVQRITLDGERKAWRSISSVVTLTLIVLSVATVLTWIFAPAIVDAMTAFNHLDPQRDASVLQNQREVATTFLRWFTPQVFLYGILSLSGVLLQIRNKFGAVSYAPIVNNVVAIAVLIWFHLAVPSPTVSSVIGTRELTLLALGTTLGLVAQFLVLVPSLSSSRLGRVRLRWDLRDEAVHGVLRLGGWTILVVIANQIALYVVLALAFGVGGSGPVSAYTYGWAFMQMPFAVVVTSVLQAVNTDLIALYASNDRPGYSQRLSDALRTSLTVVVPVAALMVILAQPIVALLLNHGDGSVKLEAGVVLAVLATGLPGYTVFQVIIRGLQAQQRGADIFGLYAFQNLGTVTLAVTLGRHSLGALISAISISYTLAAVAGLAVMHHRETSVAAVFAESHLWRLVLASVTSALATAVAYSFMGSTSGVGLALRTVLAASTGLLAFLLFFRGELRKSDIGALVRGKV